MLAGLVIAAGLVVGDGMPEPLTALPGDALRGRAIVVNRQKGLCLLCHSGPFPEEKTPGNLSNDLSGAGTRWTPAQLRLRVANARRLNPDSLMPSFHRASTADRVAPPYAGQPILSAQEVEDVVAFLASLK